MWTVFLALGVIHLVYASYPLDKQPKCKWDVRYCSHDEILCNPEESIYLDSKEEDSKNKDYCFAIKDTDDQEFKNYEIGVDLLSLESIEGINTGALGLMFNYQDKRNYDFIYLETHNNSNAALVTGYRYNGRKFLTKRDELKESISGTIYHSLRVVIDNVSLRSAKVFLDNRFFRSFQEHFVSRLKGGVFVSNKCRSVGLFKNFTLQSCSHFDENGKCTDNDVDCKWREYGTWSKCSLSSGGCTKTRTRSKLIDAKGEGKDCKGPTMEREACKFDECPGFLCKLDGWNYYKVQTDGKKMTSKLVKETCDELNLITPCDHHGSYAGPGCKITVANDYTVKRIAAAVCPETNYNYPYQCPILHGLYVYRYNWNSGAAAGITTTWAVNGNTMYNQWVLCASQADDEK